MSILKYKTRGNASPQGLSKVYFCAHEGDFAFFEEIATDILDLHNCAIFYEAERETPRDESFYSALEDMQLFVMPVTSRLLTTDNVGLLDFSFATENHIPVLPLMQESGLEELFNKKCGNLQYLSKHITDETAISFEEKFKNFLSKILVGDKLAEKIRNAFDAYIFLSYRKIDRVHAQRLMHLIHKNEFCRDIAIWYDEYLVPGENFNSAIKSAFEKSGLFVLAVTPNVIAKVTDKNGNLVDNYVKAVEYKMFKDKNEENAKLGKKEMPLIPAEMVETDKEKLKTEFWGLPDCVKGENEGELSEALKNALKKIAIKENDGSAEHNFFIGLAYLNGIDVEKNFDRALSLITFSAENGLVDACDQLINMYENGIGVSRNYETAIYWYEKKSELLKQEFEKNPTALSRIKYFYSITSTADAYKEYGSLNKSLEKYSFALEFLDSIKEPDTLITRAFSAVHNSMGNIFRSEENQKEAKLHYDQSVEIMKSICLDDKNEADKIQYTFDISLALSNLSLCEMRLGEFALAKEHLEECIKTREELVYAKNQHKFLSALALNYTELARICFKMGENNKAEKLYKKSIDIQTTEEEKNPTVKYKDSLALSYEYIGEFYSKIGKSKNAEENFKKALKLREDVFQKNKNLRSKRNLGRILNLLGTLNAENCNFKTAKEYIEQSYAIFKEIHEFSPTNESGMDLAGAYNNYAYILHIEGNFAGEIEYCEKSLKLKENLDFSNESIEIQTSIAETHNNLGTLYVETRNFEKAIFHHSKSLEIRKKFSEKFPRSVSAKVSLALGLFNIALVYQQTENISLAEEHLVSSLKIVKETPENLQARKIEASCYSSLGKIYRAKGDFEKSKESLALSIEKYLLIEKESPTTENMRYRAFAICNLGHLYREENNLKKCAELFIEGNAVFELVAEKEKTPKALQDLALSYMNVCIVLPKEKRADYLNKAHAIITKVLEKHPDNKHCIMIKNAIEQAIKEDANSN